ncbi:MAG: hypothetical protein GC165_06730 [Armatimonadetes bacterium]|nr:hypothetical protein [Armatimonadota bacterium]
MISESDHEGFTSYRLSNDAVELLVVPEIGGKIVSLKRPDGREWLWRNPHLSQQKPIYGESFVQLHDTGGWDECFPTVNPCTLASGVQLPDHGELVTQAWQVDQSTDQSISLSVEGVRLDYRFSRSISLEDDGFSLTYRIENQSQHDLPFLWCAHPLLSIEPGMTIHLPGAPKGKLTYATERHADGTEFVWPYLGGLDLSVPDPEARIGLKSFVGPLDEGWVALRTQQEQFTLSFNPNKISHVAFWMNYGAWSGSGSEPYRNLGIEPCIGAFDSLSEANPAPVIADNASLEWSLKVAIRQL